MKSTIVGSILYLQSSFSLRARKMRTKCGHGGQNKNSKQLVFNCLEFFHGTRSRGRTGTGVNLLVFETSASTDSAIRADFVKIDCKCNHIFPFGKKTD